MATQTPITPAADVPRRRTDDVLSTLAEQVGARFTASSIFGAPVERDGLTVIPVATLRFGFGGGSGSDASGKQDGEGGGALGTGAPVGYIELKEGRARFVPIVRPARMAALVAGAILAGMLVVRLRRPADR